MTSLRAIVVRASTAISSRMTVSSCWRLLIICLDEVSSKRQHDYLKNQVSLTNASPSLDEIVGGGYITLDLFFAIKATFLII
jgi:hypothetical protein